MLEEMGQRARAASRTLARASTQSRNGALACLADGLLADQESVLAANAQDIGAGDGLSTAFLDRMTLSPKRIQGVADDIRRVADLPDPIGEAFDRTILPNGLKLHKQRVPLGVLGVIYESRPNVTMDVAGLAIKTGNAVILRGGKETMATNKALVEIARQALRRCDLDVDSVQFVDDPDRARMLELLQLQRYVDLIIPRGGNALHQFCRDNSRIPVITGGMGICHIYVDESADLARSLDVVRNSKITKPSACNSLDVVLVHRVVAARFLPALVTALEADKVAFRADASAQPYLETLDQALQASVSAAGPKDFDTEWLDLVLSLRVVDNLDDAIAHINDHSQNHSDSILTADEGHAQRFVAEVDSAAVYVNAATRFTDGAQFGLGAEVAVSTQRLHARGPMGLREITTYKWVIEGDYHLRL